MTWTRRLGGGLPALALALLGSCATTREARSPLKPPVPSSALAPTRIDYVDADAFDVRLEDALVNQDPAIIIQTPHVKPEWGDRLNAWIAAWNLAGRSAAGERYRMQAAFVPKVVVDGDSIREFRLLIEGLMNRLEQRTRVGLAWLSEERMRNRRVQLLKPYNLRFHMNEGGQIQLILFHGSYAASYPTFVRGLAVEEEGDGWERKFVCSLCSTSSTKPDAEPWTKPASRGGNRP